MTALAVAPAYEAPALAWPGEVATQQPWIWWVVFVFSYVAALAWASYCISQGGSPTIEWQWWRFKITCHR
jgi:hypothetical protein